MRVIIQFSLDKDTYPGTKKHGYLTSKLQSILKKNHLMRQQSTGTYAGSGPDMNTASLKIALNQFWDKINEQNDAKLDHFWMCVDKGPSEAKEITKKK
jgi:hypothetical protein